ncbi:hypothetical protein ACI782_02800 [Geodermatophilus sp. SYSU D00703]
MSVENRLSADQLAALEPGDTVTIESEASFGRPRRAAGTVVRVTGPDIVVKVLSRHGVTHQERYRRRDGVRVGGVSRAELVGADARDPSATSEGRHRAQRIHNLYRSWNRNPSDLEALRQLHRAIGDYLVANTEASQPSQ